MYSFDVFDTLITRSVAEPKGIFALVQDTLCHEPAYENIPVRIRENFYELRSNAEVLARVSNEAKGIEEVTLEEIYVALGTSGNIDEECLKILYELEYQTELEHVIGISENIDRLKTLLDNGERVILISDMYLTSTQIRQLLVKIDKVFEHIPLYVSADYARRKTSGNLYWIVSEKEDIRCEEWIHIGNDVVQDVLIPQKIGIKTEHYEPRGLLAFEKEFVKWHDNNAEMQLSIGISRVLRKGEQNFDMGCSIAGPIIFHYAKWIVQECLEKQIKRLYFIARDGYLIKEVVDFMIKEQAIEIDTFYIYGSRKAWRVPSLTAEKFNLVEIIKWSYPERIRKVDDLAKILQIETNDLKKYLPAACSKDEERITEQEVQYLVVSLEKNEAFKRWYLAKLQPKRELLIAYLKQEIDYSDDAFAFVDLSGGGMTQGCLKKVMEEFYPKPIQTFFFKTDRVNLVEGSICNTYIPSFIQNNLIIEMVCRAPHGQTRGYLKENDSIKPVFIQEVQNLENFMNYKDGVVKYAKVLLKTKANKWLAADNVHFVMLYYKMLATSPDREVLEYFSSITNDAVGKEAEQEEYAPKLTEQDIRKLFLLRTTEPLSDLYRGTNLEYSLLRCSEEERALIQQYTVLENQLLNSKRYPNMQYGRAGFYPIHLLENRVVLYGAGLMGQKLYRRIQEYGGIEIVKWVDKNNWNESKGIYPIAAIKDISYEQIVLAIWNEDSRKEVEIELLQMGVPQNKILNPRLFETDNPYICWWEPL